MCSLIAKATQKQCLMCLTHLGSQIEVRKSRSSRVPIQARKNVGKIKSFNIARLYNIFFNHTNKITTIEEDI